MKLAVISDIHANVPALTAVLDAIAAERVDRIVCLGDVTGYHTEPDGCVDLLRQAGALCVAGNHDRAVIGALGTEGFSPIAQRAIAWTRERLAPATRDFLAALPLKRAIDDVLVAVREGKAKSKVLASAALRPATENKAVRPGCRAPARTRLRPCATSRRLLSSSLPTSAMVPRATRSSRLSTRGWLPASNTPRATFTSRIGVSPSESLRVANRLCLWCCPARNISSHYDRPMWAGVSV